MIPGVPFEAHVEVWLLIAGAIAIGWYTLNVLQPKAVEAGFDPISRRQKIWFGLAVGSMWIFSDWPIHEIAEERLYFVHMIQHLFLSLLIPALFVLATPRWLIDLLLPAGSAGRARLRWIVRPVQAGIIFNALTVFLHWSLLVQLSHDSGAVHFVLHLLIFTAGLIMWMPVCGPIAEWRLNPPAQCVYLFVMSIVPTVPSGWLIFAEDVVYRHYDTVDRLFGIDVLTDQQAAGVVMKLVGGFFLWAVIFGIFFRWANESMRADAERVEASRAGAGGLDRIPATVDQVTDEFARSQAPREPSVD